MVRRWLTLCLAVGSLTACRTPMPAAIASTTGEPIGKVRISINSALIPPDPHRQAPLAAFMGLYLMGGQLFRLKPDFSVEPYLAEGYEVSADGLVWTITLRPHLRFSDGSALTAEDVVYGYERSLALNNPRLNLLGPVRRFEATGERTVVITLQQRYPDVAIGLADHAFTIFPKARMRDDPEFFSRVPVVSSGQYVLTAFRPGAAEWAFDENPHFFDGPSMVRRVEFVAVPDETSRVLQVTTGAIDYAYDMPPWAQAQLPPAVQTFVVPIVGMYHLAFNASATAGRPLGDPRVRQALSLAIDRERISRQAFFGISAPARGFLYAGPPESLAVLPNQGRRDIAAARRLMAGTPYADGFTFTIQPWGQRPGWTDAAVIIKENLRELNIDALIEPKTDADAIANLNAGHYEAQFAGNTQDPLTFLRNQFGATGSWTRWMRYDNPEVSALLSQGGSSVSTAERIGLFHAAQRLAYDDMPLIPISERVVAVWSRIPRTVLCEANLLPGYNPRVATVREFSTGAGPCR